MVMKSSDLIDREREATAGNVVPIKARTRDELAARDRHHHRLLDALPSAIYTTDAAGRITYYNDAAAELWGYRPKLGSSEWCGSWKLFWSDGTPLAHDQCPMALALKGGEPVRGMEAIAERPDGTRVPFIPYPTPLYDDNGNLIGAVNMLVDISERKRAEEQQSIMMRELHHRVKNTLATVQAIMGATAHFSKTIGEFRTALINRIGALAKTHLLLSDEGRTQVTFADIMHNQLDAFEDGSGRRIRLHGPEVDIAPRLAVSLGMMIHELTTNAAKHGALSIYGGSLSVSWQVLIEEKRRTLDFEWIENGGPPVTEPVRKGFGSRLLELVLPAQIQARTTVEYRPEGVHVLCSVPLPEEKSA